MILSFGNRWICQGDPEVMKHPHLLVAQGVQVPFSLIGGCRFTDVGFKVLGFELGGTSTDLMGRGIFANSNWNEGFGLY